MDIIKNKLLIIDDDINFCIVTADVIAEHSFLIDYVQCPEEGIAYLEQYKDVDIVLLDYDLGNEITGLQLLEKIHSRYPNIQIIMLTANSTLEVGIESLKKGAFDYLTKPIKTDKLLERLHAAIEKRKLSLLNTIYFDILVHDLKNPLQGIQFLLDTITDKTVQDNNEKLLSLAKFSIWQIQCMIHNILKISQLENHQYTLEVETFNLKKELMIHLKDLLDRVIISGKSYDVIDELKDDYFLTSDKELFLMIIKNILWNAVKHTNKAGKISISLRSALNKKKQITIKNTGSYIDPGIQDKIFDKYFQAYQPMENKGQNFGLGLTFCQLAVQALNGQIRVESSKNPEETAFIIEI